MERDWDSEGLLDPYNVLDVVIELRAQLNVLPCFHICNETLPYHRRETMCFVGYLGLPDSDIVVSLKLLLCEKKPDSAYPIYNTALQHASIPGRSSNNHPYPICCTSREVPGSGY